MNVGPIVGPQGLQGPRGIRGPSLVPARTAWRTPLTGPQGPEKLAHAAQPELEMVPGSLQLKRFVMHPQKITIMRTDL